MENLIEKYVKFWIGNLFNKLIQINLNSLIFNLNSVKTESLFIKVLLFFLTIKIFINDPGKPTQLYQRII